MDDDEGLDDGDTGGDGDEGEDDGGRDERKDRTFTQSELDRITKRETAKAVRKARQDLADSLGVSFEDAAAIIKERNAKAEAETSEAEKARQRASEAEASAVARERKAREREARADLKAALLQGDDENPGLSPGRVDTVLKLYLADLLESDDDDLADAIADAVELARKEVPEFFGPGNSSDGNGSGTPPGPGRKLSERNGGPNPGAKSAAEKAFEERKANRGLRVFPTSTN